MDAPVLRWTNYLRPDIKRGTLTDDEEKLIIHLHSILGNKWSSIATKLPGRTDNEIKNYWNTHLRKKLLSMGIDPVTHRPRTDLNLLAGIPRLLSSLGGGPAGLTADGPAACWDINALRLQADAAKYQLLQGLLRALATPPPLAAVPTVDGLMALLATANGAAGVVEATSRAAAQQYDGLLNSFSGGGALAGDGLSSTDLVHSGASGSSMTAAEDCGRTDLNLLAGIPSLLSSLGDLTTAASATCWDINALRLQADAAKYQLLQGLLRALATPPPPAAAPSVDGLMALLATANGAGAGGICQQQAAAVVDLATSRAAATQQYDGVPRWPPHYRRRSPSPAFSTASAAEALSPATARRSSATAGQREQHDGSDGATFGGLRQQCRRRRRHVHAVRGDDVEPVRGAGQPQPRPIQQSPRQLLEGHARVEQISWLNNNPNEQV